MKINEISTLYSASGQITPADIAELAQHGFKAIICNRPDEEHETAHHVAAMAQAASNANIAFYDNPVSSRGPVPDNVRAQAEAIAATDGPILAYCRSGMRSTVCWALANGGKLPADDIVTAAANAGYDIGHLRNHLDAMPAKS